MVQRYLSGGMKGGDKNGNNKNVRDIENEIKSFNISILKFQERKKIKITGGELLEKNNNGDFLVKWFYGLNVYVSLKLLCWNS